MLTDNAHLQKNDCFAAVGDLKTYVRPVSKIIPFEIFYTEKLKKNLSLNPSPYTVCSEVDFRELNISKDEGDKARTSTENVTSCF